ncbi:late competence development ComFB family protein [Crassaminicella profunda]|uniref:late competence development ComFB family protein n=1 Tax=Crassaminicella profunda TaxID=1286698 RepID=UPI001CA7493F|nr:late competence development ComFB family protein [Crassaminicella profunda]QZY53678.1 late competence development ComFB family protein [Crassaminicella profunda]
MPKNYMEDIVNHLLPSVLEKYNHICTCDKCIKDIKALTLNNLPPLYVASEQGKAFAKSNELSRQFQVNVIQKIVEAIEIVQKNVKHSL